MTAPVTGTLAGLAAVTGLYAGAGGPLPLTLDQTGRHAALYAAAAAALILLTIVIANKARGTRRPEAGQIAVTVGALVCTGVGLNTAWGFTHTHLGITDTFTRVALCGTGEIVLIALGLAARDNLRRDQTAGMPGILVWLITAFLAVPAFAEGAAQAEGFWAGAVAGAWRAVFGPVGAAILWHFAMGLEIRAADATARSMGVFARLGRRVGQKILAAFGIADTDATTTELLRERARVKAANLSDRYAALSEKRQGGWHGRRLRRQLRAALRAANVAHDEHQKAALLADLAVSSHAPTLTKLDHDNPWSATSERALPEGTLPAQADARPAQFPTSAPGEHAHDRAAAQTERAHAHGPTLTEDAQHAHTERTEPTSAPAQTLTSPTSGERPTERARATLSLTDRKALKEQQDTLTLALYDTLGRRPEWTDVRNALVSAGLDSVSRPTAQRIRERVENAHPGLRERDASAPKQSAEEA